MDDHRAGRRSYDTMEADIKNLQKEVERLTDQVHNLVDAWNTANNLVKFIKWVSSASIACSIIWVLFTDIFHK